MIDLIKLSFLRSLTFHLTIFISLCFISCCHKSVGYNCESSSDHHSYGDLPRNLLFPLFIFLSFAFLESFEVSLVLGQIGRVLGSVSNVFFLLLSDIFQGGLTLSQTPVPFLQRHVDIFGFSVNQVFNVESDLRVHALHLVHRIDNGECFCATLI